tara:strand:+ start:17 stop:376 length:360 start_codon:yes stop_codon:yes gene_type:complete
MKILLVFVILAIMCVGCIIVISSSSLIFGASGGGESISYAACSLKYQVTTLGGILDFGRMGANCGANPLGPNKSNGESCSSNSECASGNCVGGGALGFGLLGGDECAPAGESGAFFGLR